MTDTPLEAVLNETADAYETVASLPPVVERIPGKTSGGKPGSQMPPGMSEVLDVDEYERAVREVDEWALYVAHHLLDTVPGIGTVPDTTPGRLRLAARWADRLENEPDVMARYAFATDALEHRAAMRRLARRGTRRVKTHSACLDVTCTGQYVATLEGVEASGELVCDRCGDRVPHETWERWGTRTEWVSVESAMRMLGVETKQAVWSRAKREKWRRRGEGREVRYLAEDVERRVEGLSA
jgi:hypothetical protein